MLKINMAYIRTRRTLQRRDKHAVIVNQLEVATVDHDIAMLEIAVGHTKLFQLLHHLGEPLGKTLELLRLPNLPLDEGIDRKALDPGHADDRVVL